MLKSVGILNAVLKKCKAFIVYSILVQLFVKARRSYIPSFCLIASTTR